jgi:signal transduction histidine kinase
MPMIMKSPELRRVLVVDDELGPRESLRFLLKKEFEVICVDTVDEGIASARKHQPELIILDIRMPGKTGIQGLREIREVDPFVSVIMLTGFGALETAQEAIRLGATDYLKKPFDAQEMLATVRRYVQRTCFERRRLRAADDLKDLNNRLMEEMAQKEHMANLGQASAEFLHDLRNPLTIIIGYVQLLAEQLESVKCATGGQYKEAAEYLDVIEKNVQRCYELTQMWQGFGRADLNHREPTSLPQIVRDLVVGVEPLLAGQKASIEYEVDESGGVVLGSRAQLLRAVHNLMSNAIHAVPEGTGKIRVSCRQSDRDVVLEVADNGCGMTPEQVDKAFEPYFTTKPAGKGTGLGLFITKKIIEDHQGRIHLRSQPQRGTVVEVHLPAHAN